MGHIHVALETAPLDAAAAIRLVQDENKGGVVAFLGDVRRTTDAQVTDHLVYEAYAEMALKTMREIGSAAAERYDANVALIHRLGRLLPGETSVICAAACAHRAEAFDCCRELIDRLKSEVAIWKKEIGPDGSTWVG